MAASKNIKKSSKTLDSSMLNFGSGSLKSGNEFEIRFVKKQELSLALSLSISFIDKLIAEEGLPHYKIGKSVRFSLDEIMAYLERRKRP